MADNKKAKCLSKEGIKTQLLNSMIIDENLESDDLNKEAEERQDPENAAEIIKRTLKLSNHYISSYLK